MVLRAVPAARRADGPGRRDAVGRRAADARDRAGADEPAAAAAARRAVAGPRAADGRADLRDHRRSSRRRGGRSCWSSRTSTTRSTSPTAPTSSRRAGSPSTARSRSSARTRASSSRTSASAGCRRERLRRPADRQRPVSAGSLYALMAVGLAMVFGILRLINFAHGDVMMIAAYIAVFCLGAGHPARGGRSRSWSSARSRVGLLMERIAYRPLRGAPDVAMLLSSFAVGQILQNGTLLTTRLAGHADADRLPEPGGAERRDHARDDHDPQGQRRELRGRHRAARAAHASS